MKYVRSLLKLQNNNNKEFTLFTGANLNYTKDLIHKFTLQNKNNKCLVIYPNYDVAIDKFYYNISKGKEDSITVFNCDLEKTEDGEELLNFMKSNNYKVIRHIFKDS
jgi:activator of 2-hydroxyglutaryl-CoA dehydratase